MAAHLYDRVPLFRSRLSFKPLVAAWEQIAQMDPRAHTSAAMARRFHAHPPLLEPIDDYALLQEHEGLVQDAMATIFPASLNLNSSLAAAAEPFSNRVIYASTYFRTLFMKEGNNYLLPLDSHVEENIRKAEIHLAYKLILQQFYAMDLHGGLSFICAYPDPDQEIYNYFELAWDPQFMTISNCIDLPPLPQAIVHHCHHVDDLERFPELRDLLPLEEFIFDGLLLIHIEEVTERETMQQLRELLLDEDIWEQPGSFDLFGQQVRYLLQWKVLKLGVCTFEPYDQLHLAAPQLQGLLFHGFDHPAYKEELSTILQAHFADAPHYIWTRNTKAANRLDEHLHQTPWNTVILTALEIEGACIGFLEVYGERQDVPSHKVFARLQAVAELLRTSLEKCQHHLQNKINRLVMDHFTAVQSSVEWRFNEAAKNYFFHLQQGGRPQMERIIFRQVYPLYGSIDIRNSSGERNKAVQQDMLHQLQWIRTILQKARKASRFPLLDQLLLKASQQTHSIENYLFINDEQSVYAFLKLEAAQMLHQLKDIAPSCREDIDAYFAAVDPETQTINTHQTLYEESVTRINNHIAHLLEEEQLTIQENYPHYFERFMTDGVEFNMYIGQSIAPGKPFNLLHLKNLRLWQLSFLIRIAREIHRLAPQLAVPMNTTQLVLVYSDPISISFRTAERKFDVDGVYNARYEVVKKRIDKALVHTTSQRLTQPGHIAVVYSGGEEEREYLQYFQYLQNTGHIEGEPEQLELEELQGVSGLKALRAQVVLEEPVTTPEEKQVSQL
jgi:hypothetical protein